MVTHCMVCLRVSINWDLKLERFQGDPDLVKCKIRRKINSEIHKLQISGPYY